MNKTYVEDPKLVAYRLLEPDVNHDVFRVELWRQGTEAGPLHYLCISGNHGFVKYLFDDEVEHFLKEEKVIICKDI